MMQITASIAAPRCPDMAYAELELGEGSVSTGSEGTGGLGTPAARFGSARSLLVLSAIITGAASGLASP